MKSRIFNGYLLMQKVRCFDTDKVGKESYFFLLSDFTLYEISNQILLYLTLRRIGSTLGALRLCCTNSMANRYKLRYQCISTLTGGTGTSGIGTF